ncbi:MAG: polysaccharide deacetylase family protein [Candidatus Helarchaeota archaeon]
MGSRRIVLTFDIENDCSSDSFEGIRLGLPKILRLLRKYKIPATFFVTGEVAERFPKVIQNLSANYEVGCHGFYHESFNKIDPRKVKLLKSAKQLLEEITGAPILGFRAPYLKVSQELFNALVKLNFKYDSSLAWFKINHWRLSSRLKEFWLMFPNVYFRFPLGLSLFKIGCFLNKLPVLYFHPWEGIDVRSLFLNHPNYFRVIFTRPDRWLNSGDQFIFLLSKFIKFQIKHGVTFQTLRDLYSEISNSS